VKVKSPSPLTGFWLKILPVFVPLGISTKLDLSYMLISYKVVRDANSVLVNAVGNTSA
jgi:hypothetical protein